jgi:hypothetical protein
VHTQCQLQRERTPYYLGPDGRMVMRDREPLTREETQAMVLLNWAQHEELREKFA